MKDRHTIIFCLNTIILVVGLGAGCSKTRHDLKQTDSSEPVGRISQEKYTLFNSLANDVQIGKLISIDEFVAKVGKYDKVVINKNNTTYSWNDDEGRVMQAWVPFDNDKVAGTNMVFPYAIPSRQDSGELNFKFNE